MVKIFPVRKRILDLGQNLRRYDIHGDDGGDDDDDDGNNNGLIRMIRIFPL